MNYSAPEKLGVSSADIKEYIDRLEESGLSTHDVIIARGDNVIFEKYWEPFGKHDLHRMYSVSKSFVSLAVGFAIQDGLISLDDRMIDLFPDELEDQPSEYMRNQTVRNMLMMSTCKHDVGKWFNGTDDRVRFYFENIYGGNDRPAGTTFLYDSEGSFVLGALVERKTGKPFMDYLREKLFDKIGVSKEAYCLKCPGGHSWGDSAVLCTPRDLLLVARFIMNMGRWNGEQILNEEYLRDATSDLIDTNITGIASYDCFGYGYLIWRTFDDSFFLNGMGNQFAVCVPNKDLILIYNGDNQGNDLAANIVIGSFFELISRRAVDKELPENSDANALLETPLKLSSAKGSSRTSFSDKINGVEFEMSQNSMGITSISLHFSDDRGELHYTNAQGNKIIRFGMCENVIEAAFPQEGYSDDVGSVKTEGHFYRYAASGAWTKENTLHLKVQIIDKYFGRLDMRFYFFDDGSLCVKMQKAAENFLKEYNGTAYGTAK